MLRLVGKEHCIKTVAVLSAPYAKDVRDLSSYAGLKEAYRAFVRDVQPRLPDSSGSLPEYVAQGSAARRLFEIFTARSDLTDTIYGLEPLGDEIQQSEIDRKFAPITRALKSLHATDPDVERMFNLIFNHIFHTPCGIAGGGTTSQALGVLWVDPRDDWQLRDVQEFLVHELSHMLLFLEEWRFGLYNDPVAMIQESNWALSAIRSSERPLDKAFHSVVVATEVLLLRDVVLGHPHESVLHPLSSDLVEGILTSIHSIGRGPVTLLSSRSRELLHLCHESTLSIAEKEGWLSRFESDKRDDLLTCTA